METQPLSVSTEPAERIVTNGKSDPQRSLDGGSGAGAADTTKSTPRTMKTPKNKSASIDTGIVSPGWCGGVESVTPPKPKRRGAGNRTVASPLPVRVAVGGKKQPQHRAKGLFVHVGVWVTDDADMRTLYSQGVFGKGFLSKSKPERLANAKDRRREKAKRGGRDKRDERNDQSRKRKRDNVNVDDGVKPGSKAIKLEDATGGPRAVSAADVKSADFSESPTGSLPEYLQLSLVEAFFLTYVVAALDIYDSEGRIMSRRDCWTAFRNADPAFAANYAV